MSAARQKHAVCYPGCSGAELFPPLPLIIHVLFESGNFNTVPTQMTSMCSPCTRWVWRLRVLTQINAHTTMHKTLTLLPTTAVAAMPTLRLTSCSGAVKELRPDRTDDRRVADCRR